MAARGSAGAARKKSSSSVTAGDRDKNDDEEDESLRYVPPRMKGTTLTVSFPLLASFSCIVGNCKVSFKGETWGSVLNSFTRHLHDIHKVIPKVRVNWCSICNSTIGRMVATHACLIRIQSLLNEVRN